MISRKGFFDQLFSSPSETSELGLKEHTAPLGRAEVIHLLKRSVFSIDFEFAKSLEGKTATEAVAILFENCKDVKVPPAPFDLNQPFNDPDVLDPAPKQVLRQQNLQTYFDQNYALISWWLDLMKSDTRSLSEKTTFFWTSHFTTQYGAAEIPAQWMYRQNVLHRSHKFENLKNYLVDITLDGAMLMYLNGRQNRKDAPNENYARELFELYSIGIGNYTEEDVREAAKVLTGWDMGQFQNYFPYQILFQPGFFNPNTKKIFGKEIPVNYEITRENVREKSIGALIDIILTERGDAAAKFISQKIYRYFVYNKPINEDLLIINEMAAALKSSNFDLGLIIKKILSSEHFFDPINRGINIKSPLEILLSVAANFPAPSDELKEHLRLFGQTPHNPPNVSGWAGYRTWITTKTLPAYIEACRKIINDNEVSVFTIWAKKIADYDDSAKLTENIANLYLGRLPSASRLKSLEGFLLMGAPYYEWKNIISNDENLGFRVKNLLKEIVKLPEFYLS